MFTAGTTYQKTITMVTEVCCNCGIVFGVPSDFQERCQNDSSKSFYCPNGHGQHYSKSKEQKKREAAEAELKRVRERLDQELTNRFIAESQARSADRKLKRRDRDLKRLTNGVCPCCNRTFQNLHKHMKKEHPRSVSKNR